MTTLDSQPIKQPGNPIKTTMVIIAVLLIVTFAIEAFHVLRAQIIVQNATKDGARYAITGSFEPDCLNETPLCADPRAYSIIKITEDALSSLPLNTSADFADDDDGAYFVQIWGSDSDGVLIKGFGGAPMQPVSVHVTYNVPLVTPVWRMLISNIPVHGQTVEYNERFGIGMPLGGDTAPELPPIPTAAPTPTATTTNE